ncbi:hypothetical protein TNIN_357331 [Trichonephila inaurata madagascariensis]|uniref:Uncharacterized protein n=1 Tax=Trichonephila inaurata madagascariensis TaxID=2747483 RepID=A0A8X6X428_9ARAC|nr:hypothetical protein TNIN_357331 [Trichonephila inaurata madagascariensis]
MRGIGSIFTLGRKEGDLFHHNGTLMMKSVESSWDMMESGKIIRKGRKRGKKILRIGAFSQYGLHARLAFFIHLPILPYPPVNPVRSLEFLHYCPYSMKEDTGTFFRRAYRAGARVLSIAQLLFAGAASKRYGS